MRLISQIRPNLPGFGAPAQKSIGLVRAPRKTPESRGPIYPRFDGVSPVRVIPDINRGSKPRQNPTVGLSRGSGDRIDPPIRGRPGGDLGALGAVLGARGTVPGAGEIIPGAYYNVSMILCIAEQYRVAPCRVALCIGETAHGGVSLW